MAPEALLGKKYGHKRDVWALGAMYFQLTETAPTSLVTIPTITAN